MRRLILLCALLLSLPLAAQKLNIGAFKWQKAGSGSVPVSCSPDSAFYFRAGTGWYQCVNGSYILFGGAVDQTANYAWTGTQDFTGATVLGLNPTGFPSSLSLDNVTNGNGHSWTFSNGSIVVSDSYTPANDGKEFLSFTSTTSGAGNATATVYGLHQTLDWGSSGTANLIFGGHFNPSASAGTVSQLVAVQGIASLTGTATSPLLVGLDTFVNNSSSNAVTEAIGIRAQPPSGSGTFNTIKGVAVGSQVYGSATTYGVFIEDQGVGGNNYAVYAVGGRSALLGPLQINGTFTGATTIDTATGYRIGNTAPSGNYLRGNGTDFVSSPIQSSDIPWNSGAAATFGQTTFVGAINAVTGGAPVRLNFGSTFATGDAFTAIALPHSYCLDWRSVSGSVDHTDDLRICTDAADDLFDFSHGISTPFVLMTGIQDGATIFQINRATDSSPTGNFLDFRNSADNASLFSVDVAGVLQTGSIPLARVTNLGTGVATFLGTASSANLAAAVTDETGSGAAVFATSPTLVTPNLGTPSALTLTNATGLPTAGLVNNAVTSAKMAVVNTRRVCDIAVGDTSGSALTNAQLGPQKRICYIPAAATVVEIDVDADGGTPNVIVSKNSAGTVTNLLSTALATAASGGIACSNTGGTTGIDGATTCSSTLQNTSLAAGDYIGLVSGTASTAKFMKIHVIYTVN